MKMSERKETYLPLPKELTISPSAIHGLGLFATEYIHSAVYLGVTHIHHRGDWVRTPLGGFINHNEYPNAVIIECSSDMERQLFTTRPILKGEELAIYYTLYTVVQKHERIDNG